jgi:hypothetical protein
MTRKKKAAQAAKAAKPAQAAKAAKAATVDATSDARTTVVVAAPSPASVKLPKFISRLLPDHETMDVSSKARLVVMMYFETMKTKSKLSKEDMLRNLEEWFKQVAVWVRVGKTLQNSSSAKTAPRQTCYFLPQRMSQDEAVQAVAALTADAKAKNKQRFEKKQKRKLAARVSSDTSEAGNCELSPKKAKE